MTTKKNRGYTITAPTSQGLAIIAQVNHIDISEPGERTPYDTGTRLEPIPWVNSGTTAEPDDYGKVDFEDDGGATVLTLHVEVKPDANGNTHAVMIDGAAENIEIWQGGRLLGHIAEA